MKRSRKFLAWAMGGLIAASIGFGRLVAGKAPAGWERSVARVERGTIEIRVNAMGTLAAPHSVTIASEIQSNRAKVVRLAPEGSVVREGDVLVEFDPTPFEEEVTKQTRALEEAEANLLQVGEEGKLQEAKSEQSLRDAEQRARLAELELETLEKGGGPLGAREAEARAEESEEDLVRAARDLADAEALLAQGFVSRAELEHTRARLAEARRGRDLAVASREALVRWRQPAELERARLGASKAREELARVRGARVHEGRKHEALAAKAKVAAQAARADLDKAREELARTRILSPAAGLLVYEEVPLGSDLRKIRIGDSVWQGQPIMTIPDTSRMAADAFVQEYDVHKVRPGQPARVRLEAFPGPALTGRVEFIGSLAASRPGEEGRGKRFALRVTLDQARPDLRPGMTAEVEIDVESIGGALFVPVEAVIEKDGRHFCYVVEKGKALKRAVEVGKSNAHSIAVLSGLGEGETVSLAPRRDPADGEEG